ncbi:alpha/beta fold hydrolase [uncultured Enterovirga sp.]|uniref:alpha/beta fold hydrolase n=1 Tax=uncultured Enterovirga sp. TaxID=2026352 RepID=UPI0035CB537F
MSGAAFSDVWTRSEDGLRLHARLYGPLPSGRLPVVCLPGLTRNSSEFHALAAMLRADDPDRAVLAVDYRGRGLSDHDPDFAHYTIAVETADLLRLLVELGIREATFIGVSRGGMIGMGLAATQPGLVRGLVLNDIGPVIEREGLLRIKGYVGRLGAPADLAEGAALLRARFGPHFPNLTEAEWQDWAETVWTEKDGRLVAAYDPALARTLDAIEPDSPIPDLWPFFDALGSVPVMVVRGANSDLLSAATVIEMARRHSDLETVEVADEGHTPLLHRSALASRIAAFLRRAAAAPPAAAKPA